MAICVLNFWPKGLTCHNFFKTGECPPRCCQELAVTEPCVLSGRPQLGIQGEFTSLYRSLNSSALCSWRKPVSLWYILRLLRRSRKSFKAKTPCQRWISKDIKNKQQATGKFSCLWKKGTIPSRLQWQVPGPIPRLCLSNGCSTVHIWPNRTVSSGPGRTETEMGAWPWQLGCVSHGACRSGNVNSDTILNHVTKTAGLHTLQVNNS